MDFNQLIEKASVSKFGMWKLNFLLHRYIPFNRPHLLKIISINKNKVEVKLPYQNSNLNHLKGLHACAMATAAEYASGLLLLYKLGIKDYRIIMDSIRVNYLYQGKMDAIATFEIGEEEFEESLIKPLETDAVLKECKIEVKDVEENLLCEVFTNWQIKSWKEVKTKR